jgi:hypothetical protein
VEVGSLRSQGEDRPSLQQEPVAQFLVPVSCDLRMVS